MLVPFLTTIRKDETLGISGDYKSHLTMCHIMCHINTMATLNLRQLRDTRLLKSWLRAGKTVELRERNRVIARIVPETIPARPLEWPDFAARRKKILGQRILPGADLVISERGRF